MARERDLGPHKGVVIRVLCIVLAVCLSGCSARAGPQTAYLACSIADIGSTVYGLENGYEEKNPLIAGDDTATAVLTMAITSGLIYWGLHSLENRTEKSWPWLAVGIPHCLAAAKNVETVSDDS